MLLPMLLRRMRRGCLCWRRRADMGRTSLRQCSRLRRWGGLRFCGNLLCRLGVNRDSRIGAACCATRRIMIGSPIRSAVGWRIRSMGAVCGCLNGFARAVRVSRRFFRAGSRGG